MMAFVSFAVLLLMQAPPAERLLSDHVLASLNQCRALHADRRVLSVSALRRVERAEEKSGEVTWRVFDDAGKVLSALARRAVPVDEAAPIGDKVRLLHLHRALSEWQVEARMQPKVKDRRGNVFAWAGQLDEGMVCVVYRPERDEVERTWISKAALSK